MTTSGTQTFTQTRDQIILDTFQLLGIYGVGRTVDAADMLVAVRALNKMIKAWSTKGLHLWTKEEGVMFLQPSIGSYTLGSTGRATLASDLRIHTVPTATASGSSSIVLDSGTDVLTSDKIGIVLSDKTVHWTTVSAIASNTVTLGAVLTGAVSADAVVYVYTNTLYKPLRIHNARYILNTAGTDGTDIRLASLAYQDYFDIPTKSTASQPNQFHYNPDLTSGTMYLWPQPSDGSGRVQFTYERIIEDINTAAETFDFPSEWLEAITYQLAMRLGPFFGKTKRAAEMTPLASVMLNNLLDWDSEITEITFSPDMSEY